MSKDYEVNLNLSLKPSIRLRKVMVFMHGLALVASLINAMALTFKMILFSVICIHCWISVKRLSRVNYHIKYIEGLGWQLSEGQDFVSIEILSSTVITTKVLFLHFKYRSQSNLIKPISKKTHVLSTNA